MPMERLKFHNVVYERYFDENGIPYYERKKELFSSFLLISYLRLLA